MDVAIESFDPASHDAEVVARLIYQADPSLMRFVFGDETQAVAVIARLVRMEHNDYAGRRVVCATDGEDILGIIAGATGAERAAAKNESGKEWGKTLGVKGMIRALRWGPKLEKVSTADISDDEYYISALTVDERHRGQGIGSRLLEKVLAEHETAITDVNIAKSDSIRFYEHHGFTVQRTMTFEHAGVELGNHQIRRG